MDEREEISRMLVQKRSFQCIAKSLGREVSTVSREISAGSCNQYTYRAGKAQARAARNSSKRKAGKYALDDNLRLKRYVYRKLMLQWSPNQIAQILKKDYPTDMTMRISPEAIYTYLLTINYPLRLAPRNAQKRVVGLSAAKPQASAQTAARSRSQA